MKMYHTSANKIEEGTIKECEGVFDTFLFFSNEPYIMTKSHEVYTYEIEVDEDSILEVSEIAEIDCDENEYIRDIVNDTKEYFDIEEDEDALDLLSDNYDFYAIEKFVEDDEAPYFLQLQQAKISRAMGYNVLEGRDEQGTCYMIDMYKKEHLLKLSEYENYQA